MNLRLTEICIIWRSFCRKCWNRHLRIRNIQGVLCVTGIAPPSIHPVRPRYFLRALFPGVPWISHPGRVVFCKIDSNQTMVLNRKVFFMVIWRQLENLKANVLFYYLNFHITGFSNFWRKKNMEFFWGTPPSGALKNQKSLIFQNWPFMTSYNAKFYHFIFESVSTIK